jgi:hypothetical protein
MAQKFFRGDDFKVAINHLHLGRTEYVEAEFSGPQDGAELFRFILTAREAERDADVARGTCIVQGKVPAAAGPGRYRLSRLVVQQNIGRGWSQEWPETDLPDVSFEVLPERTAVSS